MEFFKNLGICFSLSLCREALTANVLVVREIIKLARKMKKLAVSSSRHTSHLITSPTPHFSHPSLLTPYTPHTSHPSLLTPLTSHTSHPSLLIANRHTSHSSYHTPYTTTPSLLLLLPHHLHRPSSSHTTHCPSATCSATLCPPPCLRHWCMCRRLTRTAPTTTATM